MSIPVSGRTLLSLGLFTFWSIFQLRLNWCSAKAYSIVIRGKGDASVNWNSVPMVLTSQLHFERILFLRIGPHKTLKVARQNSTKIQHFSDNYASFDPDVTRSYFVSAKKTARRPGFTQERRLPCRVVTSLPLVSCRCMILITLISDLKPCLKPYSFSFQRFPATGSSITRSTVLRITSSKCANEWRDPLSQIPVVWSKKIAWQSIPSAHWSVRTSACVHSPSDKLSS